MTSKRPKDERMTGIVEAALADFLDKGYEHSTMDSIARRAGLSKGGLYHHFKSKDEILLYTNQKLNEPIGKLMHEAARQSSPSLALKFYIRRYLKFWMDRPRHLVFFFLSMTRILADKAIWSLYEQYTEQVIGFFQGLLDKGAASGEFKPHDTRAQALILMSALDGVLGYLVIDRRLDYRTTCRNLEEVLIDPLLDRRPGDGTKEHA